MSVKDRVRLLELQSKTTTPIKPSRNVTPSKMTSPVAPLYSAMASPQAESEVDTEAFEDAEEDRPGMNQRILFLRHPPFPVSLDYN